MQIELVIEGAIIRTRDGYVPITAIRRTRDGYVHVTNLRTVEASRPAYRRMIGLL